MDDENSDQVKRFILFTQQVSVFEHHFLPKGSDLKDPSQTLYPSAKITKDFSSVSILKLAARHNLTKTALSDILKLISRHLPSDTATPSHLRSVYMLEKWATKKDKIEHTVCLSCAQLIGEDSCSKPSCKASGKGHVKFIELSVEKQITKFFQGTFDV